MCWRSGHCAPVCTTVMEQYPSLFHPRDGVHTVIWWSDWTLGPSVKPKNVSELYTLCFSTVLIFVPMVLQFQGCVNYNPLGGTTSHVPISKYRQHAKPQKSWNTTSPPCHIGYVAVREVLQHCVPNHWTIQLSFTNMWSPLHSLPYYTQSVSCRFPSVPNPTISAGSWREYL
jgi:hypothetical protein